MLNYQLEKISIRSKSNGVTFYQERDNVKIQPLSLSAPNEFSTKKFAFLVYPFDISRSKTIVTIMDVVEFSIFTYGCYLSRAMVAI